MPLEQKITLSIWIRLLAEKHMLDNHWWVEQEWNQMFKLYGNVKSSLSDKEDKLMKKVMIYTPESIHLNAFMFEPIIDVSSKKFIFLYKELKKLI